jgi:hypothetical protein
MFPPRLAGFAAILLVSAATLAGGCGSAVDDRPPQWSFISATIIEPSCATVNCHSAITHQGGVDLSAREIGYLTLVNGDYTKNDGDPSSSTLVTLLNAVGSTRMPPDNPLSEADIQLIASWIGHGALDN